MSDLINVLILAFIGSIVALIGGVVFLFKKSWSSWLSAYSVPFAAGVLLTVALVGLLPEAFHMIGEKTFIIVLISFLAAYLFESFICGIHHHEKEGGCKKYESSVPLVIAGDTLHNFVDGVGIAAAYLINPGLGVITAISTFLHEVPHEIGDFGILLKAGWERRRIIIVNILSASATIIGALVVFYFVASEQITGTLLAISIGLFLYLGASDFLPHIEDEKISRNKAVLSLIIGVLIMLIAITAVPHAHEETDEHHTEGVTLNVK
ncbi:hypothetical protein A2164_04190 [Candidatus Curtissbacteria bacterium RBG_13_35_7]|uniref:ZIP zinc transporter n=1 Tax=Candidatus Curtissbacteria bacterium RBG_13_35_7 TaxID=1797705 RepID=A0A1F5G573_9BACT|nr:MAG: hypothetical protein A2164_04190 [Candidatus Curtissbacteria bacterium RBG_13_35_7]